MSGEHGGATLVVIIAFLIFAAVLAATLLPQLQAVLDGIKAVGL